ncbi:conjugal transfer protein TraD [Phenylobacterium sp.]|uniref:conjugal transfer protein TraD n=1 Tax=Phenylobacterium sp. TaxID=1871053 RepID=UPI0030F4A04D
MRKPRDIDAELQALAERAKGLKSRKVSQLGELAIATGADALSVEVLAGALLAAAKTRDETAITTWRRQGEAFFRRTATRRVGAGAGQDTDSATPHPGSET